MIVNDIKIAKACIFHIFFVQMSYICLIPIFFCCFQSGIIVIVPAARAWM